MATALALFESRNERLAVVRSSVTCSHYAKTVDGKISSAVMASTGIESSDSNEVSQFEQYHR